MRDNAREPDFDAISPRRNKNFTLFTHKIEVYQRNVITSY
jgi:hypothetical protein